MNNHLSLKRSLFAAISFVCMALAALSTMAQFAFTTNNGVAEITSYSGTNIQVEIPSLLDGCPVTSIGANAFSWKTAITRVTIPSGVTNVGPNAFSYCYNLAQVSIPEGTLRLGNGVFNQCTSLSAILLPQSLTNIGTVPFGECSSLQTIDVAPDNPVYASHEGVLLNKALTTLIECPGGKIGGYVVPQGVTNIMAWAFDSCRRLTSVILPEALTSLGVAAFYDCRGLTNAVIPGAITVIPHSAFGYCTNLLEVTFGTNVALFEQDSFTSCTRLAGLTFPDSVQNIGWGAFSSCAGLTNIHFGTNLLLIGNSAFSSCSQLRSLWLPDSLQAIQAGAFATCSQLSTVRFGRDLSQLAGDAFKDCPQLVSYEVDPQNNNYQSVGGVLFNSNFSTLLRCPLGLSGVYHVPLGVNEVGAEAFYHCASLQGIILSDTVHTIGYNAFNTCTALTSLTIPAGVTNMQTYSLAWCGTALKSVFFGSNPPAGMDDSVFYGDSSATLYYLPGASGWSSPFCGRPAVRWDPQPRTDLPDFGIQAGKFGFQINGSEGIPFVVEACDALSGNNWTPLQTNVLTGGAIDFSDPDWTNHPTRFYRIRSP